MFTINRIIGWVLMVALVYSLLKLFGVLPNWMPGLPMGTSVGA
jgi:hypothetical protein